MSDANLYDDPHSGEQPSRRKRRRSLIHDVFVAIDAPTISDPHWVVDALDINADGLGLVLPSQIPEGTEVELTFKLADDAVFSRMPATVRHQLGTSGGVQFGEWPESERLKLLEFLVALYEIEG